jgi:hypothetical protein
LQQVGGKYLEQISNFQIKLTKLQERNRRLLSKLSKQRQLNPLLLKDLEKRMDKLSGSRRDAEQFFLPGLSQMRILIIGGPPKTESLYRRLIEEREGMFEYHNGHMTGSARGLEYQVRRADVVLCRVDYNSHAATLAVKRLGKKHRKPVRMLANSSLSTISQELSAHQGGNGKWRDKEIE